MCGGEREGISIWNIVKQNHPYDTSSNFPGQQKKVLLALKCMANYKFNA